MSRSWFSGKCKICNFPVVVTQPDPNIDKTADYQWYCSNPKCENHETKEHTGDMEIPEWVNWN